MQTNFKYLYGKLANLDPFICNGDSLWFRDIYSLNNLENKIICDDERSKKFIVDSKRIKKISLNGRDFQLAPDTQFTITQPTRRCHVLCLSNDGNNEELFQRFNADVCIEIDVEFMIEMIRESNKQFNIEVIGKEVIYYKVGNPPENLDPKDIVFKKEYEKYGIEKEYRIAIFWPEFNESVMTEGGNFINVFGDKQNSDDHITIGFTDMNINDLVTNIHYKINKSIKA